MSNGSDEAPPQGAPREQYERTYLLLPPHADASWARAVVRATWGSHRFTIGGSADDAGIGALAYRRVIAINPADWGDDLATFFARYYPGVTYIPIAAQNPYQVQGRLLAFCLRESGIALAYPTTHQPRQVTGEFGIDRGSYFHNGLDLASSWDHTHDEALAAADGEVMVAGLNAAESWFGYQVRLRCALPNGQYLWLRYAHLKPQAEGGIYVAVGQRVTRGERLGRPDSTGQSTGDHLHFDVKVGEGYADPQMLIA